EEAPVAGEEARDEDHRAAVTPRHGAAVEDGGAPQRRPLHPGQRLPPDRHRRRLLVLHEGRGRGGRHVLECDRIRGQCNTKSSATIRAMPAAVLHGPRDLRVEYVPDPVPGPGEVVVRGLAVAPCGTDYSIWTGARPVRYPLVMGHEFIGRVAAVGEGVANITAGEQGGVGPD